MSERTCPECGSDVPPAGDAGSTDRCDRCGADLRDRPGPAIVGEERHPGDSNAEHLLGDRRFSRWAIASLILGISSFFGLCLLSLICGPLAWWAGDRAKRQISRHPLRYRGRSMATVGSAMGSIGCAALVVAVIVGVVAFGISC